MRCPKCRSDNYWGLSLTKVCSDCGYGGEDYPKRKYGSNYKQSTTRYKDINITCNEDNKQ